MAGKQPTASCLISAWLRLHPSRKLGTAGSGDDGKSFTATTAAIPRPYQIQPPANQSTWQTVAPSLERSSLRPSVSRQWLRGIAMKRRRQETDFDLQRGRCGLSTPPVCRDPNEGGRKRQNTGGHMVGKQWDTDMEAQVSSSRTALAPLRRSLQTVCEHLLTYGTTCW